ncbi:MAG: beta-lactamase family protein [Microcystis aeruginosa PMC 728.11]|jgi:CubicO group peptidase (beta-lactamase class C family)|uniref:serine hydrolase domain-containing protein n=1 Tax=Microcystis sp. LE19-84.1B TaxID=3016438 RepID=UPI001DBAF0C9|nr:serine hydrolase domain-containing protein [Microcystis sp. LE19-84.1B]MBE5229300.1 beta-lactamase family protein [Microcystis aeruginosa PMC 728.11]MCZ8227127.1 serine hydrolase [Microcystis sp. LE19-84.1B]
MQQNTVRLTLGGILLVMAACAPQSPPTPTLPPPTSTVLSPTAIPLPPTATSFPTTPVPTAISPDVITSIDTMLKNLADKGLLNASVLIGQRGKVLLSKGYGLADREKKTPNTAQTRFRLGSITKQFTAMAILMLEMQGKLKVQDPICKYIADCPSTWQAITIHHLLTHTSGIPDFTALRDYQSSRATPSSPEQTIARFKDLPLDFQPGGKWSYSNSGYIVLGFIIEKVSSQTYEDFLQQAIFTPLNLRDTGYDHNANGLAVGYKDQYSTLPADYIDMSIPYAAGALYSTIGDLYAWENALSTEQLTSQAYLDEMFAPQAPMPDSGGWAYGYGWAIGTDLNRAVVSHGGNIEGFASIVMRYLDEQVVIIVLSNQENKDVGLIENIIAKKLFGIQ